MAVYVDNMHEISMGNYNAGRGRVFKMSHMMADTLEELNEMADKIGIKRKWFQGDHYDICKSKRELAVKNGAIEISMREMALKRREIVKKIIKERKRP